MATLEMLMNNSLSPSLLATDSFISYTSGIPEIGRGRGWRYDHYNNSSEEINNADESLSSGLCRSILKAPVSPTSGHEGHLFRLTQLQIVIAWGFKDL